MNSLNYLSNDLLLIIECCKDEPSITKLENYYSNIKSWNSFIYKAKCHGVLPLIYKTLKTYNTIQEKDVLANLRSIYFEISKDNMKLSAELIEITKILNIHNINYLSFKGPLLSISIYNNIINRQYCDIDILVSPDDINKISEILNDRGYKKDLVLTTIEENFKKDNSHELSFFNKKKNILLEFHWNLVDNDHPIKFNLESFFSESINLSLNKYKVNTFKNEHLLVYLTVHGCNHLYERLEWIVDIDKLVRNNLLNWDIIDSIIINSIEVNKSFLFSCYYSFKLFNTPIPSKYLDEKYEVILVKILKELNSRSSIFKRILLRTKFISSYSNKIKVLHKLLFKPTLNEIKYIKFRKKLYFLYYFVRLYLIIKKR